MTSGEIVFGGMIGVAVLGVAYLAWRVWGDHQADRYYAQVKAGAGTDLRHALQGKSFTVGIPSDFIDGDLQGHFRWLTSERAWGLRIEKPSVSLRSLAGTFVPLWILQGDAGTWVRHPNDRARLRAYNADVSLVLPTGLNDGDQIRLGEDGADRGAA